METYPVDIDPGQIVRWIRAENKIARRPFRTSATRKQEVQQLPAEKQIHFGDIEKQDLSEIATIATLEIVPFDASDGWLLRIVAVDEAGPRVPASGAASEGEMRIDLGAFYKEFILPERGIADVVAEVNGPVAKRRLTRLLNMIERDHHGAGLKPKPAPAK
jgi:hypothetical protein